MGLKKLELKHELFTGYRFPKLNRREREEPGLEASGEGASGGEVRVTKGVVEQKLDL